MSENLKPERDDLGDVRMPKLSDDFLEKQRTRGWTHVFHFKDKNRHFVPVNYDGQPIEKLRPDLPRFDLITLEIFKSPDSPPYDEWMGWKSKYEYYLETYFRPVFANRPKDEDRPLRIEKSQVVMPKERYEQFQEFVAENNLKEHEDFILFLLCKMEDTYIHEIAFDDQPEQRERIRKFPQEVEKLIKALKLAKPDHTGYDEGKGPPQLQQITFQYNTVGPIKITDSLLLLSITDSTRNSFKEGPRKDWEKQLRAFPQVYNENQQPNEFRYRMCKALHNFFKGVGAFNYGKNETTDAEVLAIAWMMYFSHVRFFNKADKEYDLAIDRSDLVKVVRLYITRKELVYHPTHYTVNELKPDLNKLLKYFDKDFLRAGSPVYSEQSMGLVLAITDQFGVNHLFPELLHLYHCLDAFRFIVGHQLQTCFNEEQMAKNSDYSSLKILLATLKANGNINEMQFKLDNKEQQFGFAEKLPLELMKQALLEYYENHKADFEIDLYESRIEIGPRHGSFTIVPTGKLNEPARRLLPVFVGNAYRFLLAEAPPGEFDYLPSERYYGIIALLLLRNWYFGHQMWDEGYCIEQVKYWHSLK